MDSGLAPLISGLPEISIIKYANRQQPICVARPGMTMSIRELRQERHVHAVALRIARIDEHGDVLGFDVRRRIEPQVLAVIEKERVPARIEPARNDAPWRAAVDLQAAVHLDV